MTIWDTFISMGAGWGLLGVSMRLRRRQSNPRLFWPVFLLLLSLTVPLLEGVLSGLGWNRGAFFETVFRVKSYPFLYGPLLWWYTRRVLGLPYLQKGCLAVHFIPFVLWGGVALLGWLSRPTAGEAPALLMQLHGITNAISLVVYGIAVLRLLGSHNRTLEDRYADLDESVSLQWLRRLVVMYLVCFGAAIGLILFRKQFGSLFPFHPESAWGCDRCVVVLFTAPSAQATAVGELFRTSRGTRFGRGDGKIPKLRVGSERYAFST